MRKPFKVNEDMLRWIWDTAGGQLRPFQGLSEMEGNHVVRQKWSCYGCKGEFWSEDFVPYVGYGPNPTHETFPHEKDCRFVKLKELVELAFKNAGRKPFYSFYESNKE